MSQSAHIQVHAADHKKKRNENAESYGIHLFTKQIA
jgi:hypothetical protein